MSHINKKGNPYIIDVSKKEVTESLAIASGEIKFDPASIDLPRPINNEIIGKDINYNANRIIEIFNGKDDSFYRSVCINSAFGLLAHENRELNEANILKAYKEASDLIKGGGPLNQINKLIIFTNK